MIGAFERAIGGPVSGSSIEYAIELGDGTLTDDLYTTLEDAEWEISRLIAASITVRPDRTVARDPVLRFARIVVREVGPWMPLASPAVEVAAGDGSAPVEPPPVAPGADHPIREAM